MTPTFAVVGHPNKGKSSIVATLAQDESVEISPTPGTTVRCREFPMRVNGEILYVLVDTPGFQRPRGALEWMRDRETDASARAAVVEAFADEPDHASRFADECELLRPILAGAGILYVVDGSRPFGAEYEAEMEILRWTGRPSMALVNMIGDGNHVAEWRAALEQYFRTVRVFDAVSGETRRRLNLLEAFAHLDERWSEPLNRAVAHLRADRDRRRRLAALAIAELLVDLLITTVTRRLPRDAEPSGHRQAMLDELRATLSRREQAARRHVEGVYDYRRLVRSEAELDAGEEALFSERAWLLWGLDRLELAATGAMGGAAVGGGVDLALGGASLLLGAGLGALVGAAGAVAGFDRLADVKVMGRSLGGTELVAGPVRNPNFPYVVLGRALHHHARVASRAHARREELVLENDGARYAAGQLSSPTRRSLEAAFRTIRSGGTYDAAVETLERLAGTIERAMEEQPDPT